MELEKTEIPDVILFKPKIFHDERGYFYESYNQNIFSSFGFNLRFVQDNHSCSKKGVLRGLHYQLHQPQGKLVRVVRGEIFDVAVDLRHNSVTFCKWIGRTLSYENKNILWIPAGFAHGFVVLSEWAEVLYKTTDYYAPSFQRTLRWDDPTIGIQWPITEIPHLSNGDKQGMLLSEAELYSKEIVPFK